MCVYMYRAAYLILYNFIYSTYKERLSKYYFFGKLSCAVCFSAHCTNLNSADRDLGDWKTLSYLFMNLQPVSLCFNYHRVIKDILYFFLSFFFFSWRVIFFFFPPLQRHFQLFTPGLITAIIHNECVCSAEFQNK